MSRQISSKSVKNCDRESADRQTDRQTDGHTDRDDSGDLIICPIAIAMGQIIIEKSRKKNLRIFLTGKRTLRTLFGYATDTVQYYRSAVQCFRDHTERML